jgi:predicted nucleic acid-binding protein
LVIADSNIWIHYLRDPNSEVGLTLQALLDKDQVLMTGVVLSEVLQGARTEREYEMLLPRLTALPYQEMNKRTWASAGRIGLRLRMKDGLIPLTDLAIAALAIEYDHQVCTLDGHFDRVVGLKRYPPTAETARQ